MPLKKIKIPVDNEKFEEVWAITTEDLLELFSRGEVIIENNYDSRKN